MTRQQTPPSIRILTGLNAGAVCTLPNGRFSIGSESPAQILLSDERVAPRHVTMERDENGLRLSIEAPGVRIEGTDLAPGDVIAAVLPITLSIADVDIRCEDGVEAEVPSQRLAWPFKRIRISPLGAGAAISAALLAGIALLPVATNAFVLPGGAASSSVQRNPAPEAAETHASPVTDAVLQSETKARLQAENLANLSIAVSNGVVTVQGQIDPASTGRLHDVELWFDRRFGQQAVFMSQVASQAARKFAIPIDAVWNGPEPNVVVHGQRYYVGSSLPGGASISQITPHQVLVSDKGQSYAFDY